LFEDVGERREKVLALFPGLLGLRESEFVLQKVEHVGIGFSEHLGSSGDEGEIDSLPSSRNGLVDFLD
jgi:hypothetical protein